MTAQMGMMRELCSWDNLFLAYRNACRGKRRRRAAAAFEPHLAGNLLALQRRLEERSRRPGPYLSLFIHERKRRVLSAVPFCDGIEVAHSDLARRWHKPHCRGSAGMLSWNEHTVHRLARKELPCPMRSSPPAARRLW